MQKDTLINVLIYLASFVLIWTVAYPIYNGGGTNLLQKPNNILYELAKKNELETLYNSALEMRDNGIRQAEAFSNLDATQKERVDFAIAKNLDMARVVNDLDKVASASKMKMIDIKFAKNINNKKFPNLNTYDIDMSVEGDYINFRDMIRVIENSLELYNIKSVSFSKEGESEGGYKMSIALEAFELK